MIKALAVLVGIALMGIGATFTPLSHVANSFLSATAQSGVNTVFGAPGVSCSFSGATVKQGNFTAVTLSWTANNATDIKIGSGVGGQTPVVGATTTTSASTVTFITQATTYLLIAGDGSSTSTCTFTASPA